MRNTWIILKRELTSIFLSPIAYVVLVCFLLLNGVWFLWVVLFVSNDPMQLQGSPLQAFFGGTFLYYLGIFMVCPLITMRMLSEELRSGTIETLMTAPVRDIEVVAGKYAAALLFYVFLWVPTLLYVILVWRNASSLDWGPVWSGYLGTFLIGAMFTAVGILMSAISKNQIIAYVLTAVVVAGLFSLGIGEYLVTSEGWKSVWSYVNMWGHMDDFAKGIVDTRRVAYYVTGSVVALYGALRVVEARRWRG